MVCNRKNTSFSQGEIAVSAFCIRYDTKVRFFWIYLQKCLKTGRTIDKIPFNMVKCPCN